MKNHKRDENVAFKSEKSRVCTFC